MCVCVCVLCCGVYVVRVCVHARVMQASGMFRAVDHNFDGALTPQEFVEQIKHFNIETRL